MLWSTPTLIYGLAVEETALHALTCVTSKLKTIVTIQETNILWQATISYLCIATLNRDCGLALPKDLT